MVWQHGVQRTPCQLDMTHFAATRRTEAAHFADRIGREVIMQHEALVGQASKAVNHLLGVLGAERRGADRLRFATREQRRTMRSEEHTSELQSLMRNSYAVFYLKKKKKKKNTTT